MARELFYWNGIRATGVDRVASDAGISPTTLYRLFRSKDDLVAAYVEQEGAQYREWFERAIDLPSRSARDRILALYADLEQQLDPEICRGCPFQMALAETPDAELAAHRNATATKAWVRDRLLDLARQLADEEGGAPEPEALADHMVLVMEGAYASASSLGAGGPSRRTRELVERLLPDVSPAAR